MTKTKTYLDIVKKNVDSNILENLWNESISELTNNYLNEGYTLEELEPSVRKFSYTDVVRIAEDFIIHPYSKICLYRENVYRIEENGNMIRVPVYLYESYGINEDFIDGLKKVIGFGKDIAVGAYDWFKGINIMDLISDPHTIMDLLSALLVGVGVGTGAMTGGVSTLICTIAASLIDVANIVWYLNDLKKEQNPVVRGGIYLGLAFSVVSMTFPIPNPQTITAEGTKLVKLSSKEIFKTISNPKNWMKEMVIPSRFPEGRTAELIKLIGAGAAGYEVFGELISGNLKKYGVISEDSIEKDSVYNWIGLLIGVLVMYKMGRLLTILGKPLKAFLGSKVAQKMSGVISDLLSKILNFMKTNGSNIFTKLLESIGIKKHIDDIVKTFSDSNFVKQFDPTLEGIGTSFKKSVGDSPDLDTSLINELPIKNEIAGYCGKSTSHYSPVEMKKIVDDVFDILSNTTKNLSNEKNQTYLRALEQKILKGEKIEPEYLNKLLKEVESGKSFDELVGVSNNKLIPNKTSSKNLTNDIEKFAETENGKELIDSITNAKSSILSKNNIDDAIIEKLKKGKIPTEKKEISRLANAIIDKDIKLSDDAFEEFFKVVMPKLGIDGIKKSSIQESKSFLKNIFSKKERKPYVFVDSNTSEFKTIPLSELKNYKTIYHITSDVIGGKIDNLSARSFFFLLGRATGLNKAAGNKTDAAYAFDPIELGLTDVRGGKIISDDYNLFDKLKDSEIIVDLVNLFQDMNWLLFPYVARAVQGTLETETHTQKAMKIPSGLSNFELNVDSIQPGMTFDSIPEPLKNVIRVSKALVNNLKKEYNISSITLNVDGAITPAYISAMQELIMGFKTKSGGNILINPINKYKVNLNTILEDLNILGIYLLSAEELRKQYPDANV